MKLEFGSQQTLAYQDEDGNWKLFETPDYAEELAKCQRYLYIIQDTSNIGVNFAAVLSAAGNEAFVYLPVGVSMRTNPTASITRLILVDDGGRVFDTNIEGDTFSISAIKTEGNGVFIRMPLSKKVGNVDQAVIARIVGKTTLSAEL